MQEAVLQLMDYQVKPLSIFRNYMKHISRRFLVHSLGWWLLIQHPLVQYLLTRIIIFSRTTNDGYCADKLQDNVG